MSAMSWFWDGDAMRPARRFVAKARETFKLDERYVLEAVEEEQSARDMAYHAYIREAWAQLPEQLSAQFPSPTDFRRHLLIACGFATTRRLQFASVQAAQEAIGVLGSLAAEIEVRGAVVTVKTPMSQKLRGGMPKAERLRSYQETQDLAAALIGARPDQVEQNAREAA